MNQPRIIFLKIVLALTLFLLPAIRPLPSWAESSYKLAVMDLDFSGASRREMNTVEDELADGFRRSQRLARTVGRAEREQILASTGRIDRKGTFGQYQRRLASQLRVDLAVTGSLKKNHGRYILTLQIIAVTNGELLKEIVSTYSGVEGMRADCARLALDLLDWQGWKKTSQPVIRKKTAVPFKPRIGLAFGHEAVSGTAGVGGGSYLYPEAVVFLSERLGFGFRYSFRLFPDPGSGQLALFQARFSIPVKKSDDIWISVKPGFLCATDDWRSVRKLAGVTLVPFYSGDMGGLSIEVFPISVYFDLSGGKPLLMFEFISIGLTAPLRKK